MSESAVNPADQPFDGAVAEAVHRLGELDALAVDAHADVFERVHSELHAALIYTEPDAAGHREPG
jgi:hypothetical protein